MAEALFRVQLPPRSPWQAASAGLSAVPGLPASEEAAAAVEEQGADLAHHISRPLTAPLIEAARLIVAMTRSHRDLILMRFPAARQKVYLLKSFDPACQGPHLDLDDPIGGDLARYRSCRDEIARCLPDLTAFLDNEGASHEDSNASGT